MNVFRQFGNNIFLRIVNIAGLAIMLVCLLISAGYIKHELNFDRHHTNADLIVRMTLQFDNGSVDGRIYGNAIDDVLRELPEIDRTVKMYNITTAVLTYQGDRHIVNDFYMVNREFLNVFDIPLLFDNKDEVLQRENQVLISESFARQLFGDLNFEEVQSSEISIENRRLHSQPFFISGIFEDFPEASHFHTDILLYCPDNLELYTYTYLLLKNKTDINTLAQKITELTAEKGIYLQSQPRVLLMPLTDIHLHSHNLREMSVNGNIHYIYLIIGANILLLIVVFFNLWLNASLIFSYNRRYYQILRLHGASSSVIIKKETLSALLMSTLSIIIGVLVAYYVLSHGFTFVQFSVIDIIMLCLIFLLSVVFVSLMPALKGISYTLFLNTDNDLKPVRFSYSNVKYMITAQYAVVMIVVILAFGINKQMNLVKDTQVGGNDRTILVMAEQPEQVMTNFALLKTEMMKHTEIESITTSFQLPGDAIRDVTQVRREDDPDWKQLPILITGEDFLPFFNINLIAGQGFSPAKYDYYTEMEMFIDRLQYQKYSENIEEYVINRKALAVLGFSSPEEAIGEMLRIEHSTIDYFRQGVIIGVTDDFNYTGLYEETIPLLMMQRRMFQFCILARLAPDRFMESRAVFEKVWNEVNPDYPPNYIFMKDLFGNMYRNEMNAQQLVYIFSLLCFLIADLGLIIFMAFIIRRRTKEIGIRKVHGASVGEIIRMLNMNFIRYIALAFIIAVPVAYYIMHRWLERFAYRVSLDLWIFVLAGFIVLLISFASVSFQSWRAATINPVDAIEKG
ncbi:MAG: ABC transporter permease [Bacteroidales bacterium]|jgi:putative ABC transport system permease protein|nr:ABC transporter permease [Bacteroidales bacterium]